MNLLVLTQKVNLDDTNLGFFHTWLKGLAEQVDSLIVVCLEKGRNEFPDNVKVLSLGKEAGQSRSLALWRFYKYIILNRSKYDGVFVHMNTEYVLLGGLLWRIWGKKILLWYTHKAATWQLRVAEKLVTKIFTASTESFRLFSKKLEIVGHGIEVKTLALSDTASSNLQNRLSLLAVGRLSPTKDFETVIRAIFLLNKKIPSLSLDIVGDPIISQDFIYKDELNNLIEKAGLDGIVNFVGGRRHGEMSRVYATHKILIHTSQTGSVDKVVLEALASGRIVVTSSEAFRSAAASGVVYAFPPGDFQELARIIEKIYNSGIILPSEKAMEYVRNNHNLDNLIYRIISYFKE